MVYRRNEKLIVKAAESNAIVSSVFPTNIRDRLIGQGAENPMRPNLKSFVADSTNKLVSEPMGDKPLADLFLSTTVLFADISGFTAWSSSREPTQVLMLLEKVYNAFDGLTKRRKVLKIETVGDCYVAATGLPEPNPNHAVAMARYARDIMLVFGRLTKDLECTLGPGTST